ncbi:MAG: thioredoxin domain-containing protein [bacterium]
MKRKLIFISIILAFLLVNVITLSFGKNDLSITACAAQSYAKSVSYNDAVKLNKPVVVTFYADWCGYCRRFIPIHEDLASEFASKYTFVNVNVDAPENQQVVKSFNVRSYPSLFLVNPKTGEKQFINQRYYIDKAQMEKEFNKFLK